MSLRLTFLEHIMLVVILSFFIGAFLGFLGGVLTYRNNIQKLQAKETEGKKLLDALKGK